MEAASERLARASRVLVLGPPGSGKTRFAERLGAVLNLKVVHLDTHFWRPGWVPTPRDAWRRRVRELAQEPAWIMDGTYERSLDLRVPAADAIVLIESSRAGSLWRVIKRKLAGDGSRKDAPPGQPIDAAFLRYIWRYGSDTQPLVDSSLASAGTDCVTLRLNGLRDCGRLFEELEQRPAARVR